MLNINELLGFNRNNLQRPKNQRHTLCPAPSNKMTPCDCVSVSSRGLHHELQRPLQPPAQTPGGRKVERTPSNASEPIASAWASATAYHRTDHVLLPALRHGCWKGAGHVDRHTLAFLRSGSSASSDVVALQDVLLFYYTQWCGFCSVLNHVLIQLARLLQRHGGVTLARYDYTVPAVPRLANWICPTTNKYRLKLTCIITGSGRSSVLTEMTNDGNWDFITIVINP